ncbi:hypothetical protein V1477_012883 [Vespula maculifrons]|uniref:Uncharacterized protein n=1 Tax=Vespula maculifrons TaxID=7453 RepID=A0ABD2BUB5_VESMC
MSKSIIWRRSRREREEKKAGTCAHVRGIEFGRERRRHIGKVTRARVTKMKGKRKDGHRTQFQCIASTTDPGPTAWRLLYLGTRGLTSMSVGLLFAPANTTSLSADKGVSVLPILPVFASGNRL